MGIVNGIFVFNGTPQNGAAAKLWDLDGFASYVDSGDTVQDAPLAIDSIELNVVAGAGFAVDDVIKMENELCKIWFINTNLLYIIRGWRGTAPAAHANGIAIYDETITAPSEDDAEPGAGQVGAAVTTGVTYGGDGAYRWTAVAEGEYYASIEYDGHRAFFHHLTERDDPTLDQITRTRGDIIFRGVDGVNRLPKGNVNDLLQMGANDPNWIAGGSFVATREVFVPVTFTSGAMGAIGGFPVANLITGGQYAVMAFKVPWDYSAITNAEVITIPKVTDGAANWDLDSDYGEEGELYNAQSENENANTYNVTLNTIFAVNIVPVLSAIVPGDYVGIKLTLADTADDLYVVGVRFRYS